MSAVLDRQAERARAALTRAGAVLIAEGRSWRVYPDGDRRRRALAELCADTAALWVRTGVIEPAGGSQRWRLRTRGGAAPSASAGVTSATAGAGEDPLQRLARLTSGGSAWFTADEIAAAERLRAAARRSEAANAVVADWTGAPQSKSPRTPGLAGAERAVMARADVRAALGALGPELAPIVERACVREQGLEAIEAAWGWPKRSAKVVLKLALRRLDGFYRTRARAEPDWDPAPI
ncbi:MAG: DUF6456 domain-containing protein [Maricaulaceae bacterium]